MGSGGFQSDGAAPHSGQRSGVARRSYPQTPHCPMGYCGRCAALRLATRATSQQMIASIPSVILATPGGPLTTHKAEMAPVMDAAQKKMAQPNAEAWATPVSEAFDRFSSTRAHSLKYDTPGQAKWLSADPRLVPRCALADEGLGLFEHRTIGCCAHVITRKRIHCPL